MSADLVGYSRLVRADEEGTISTFKSLLADRIDPVFGKYSGRMVKLMGDGMLVAFSSVVDAVRAAVEMQRAIADYNTERPQDARFDFRVGINLGDVVIDGDDIHGDGVNLAARLEGLAEPGGINISGSVYEQVRDRVEYQFTDLGEQTVKNIDRPLRVWRWLSDQQDNTKPESSRKLLALPDKPSIAVLPFDNMSGDADQEYFADGITEDIITALSKFRWFFVIARNSTFVYKGQAIDISQVGRELGVRYVLEGSVRKSADRIRITAQLIESESGNHVWAERYDRSLTEIFELQDEITSTIAAAVEPELAGVERERALRKPTQDLGAWDLFQRGVALVWRQQSTSIDTGSKLIREAVDLDPDFGQAHGYLAFARLCNLIYEWVDNREESLQQGISDASKAIAIDQRDYFAHHALGRLNTLAGDHPAAVRSLETSVGINPNFALGYVGLGEAHVYGGDPPALSNTWKSLSGSARMIQ